MNRLTVFSLPCALVVWLLALQVVKVNAATSQVLLTYGNGSVVSNVEVEYGTSTQIIGSGKVVGTYLETNNIKTNLSDLVDVRPYLRSLVLAGTLNPNANSYVAIHYPTGVTISTSDLGTSCQQFGGYHSAVYVGDISPNVQYMYYGVLPYCGTTALDMAPAISHELGETVTDPLGNTGWYHASTGQEIGDLCNGMNGMVDDPLNPGNSLTIQKLWSNVQQKCISSRSSPLPPPASYSSTSSKKIYDATLSSRPVSIQSVEITPIFYGMNVSFKANLTDFYKFLVTSPYIGARKLCSFYFLIWLNALPSHT
ncbi:hypothetical protein BC830DRAFT_1077618 [Chytriomyces sp. MP71]|nr:hypothetical protein BC830DRAFT_1077618 [Chytriomyces sp. MP71]